MLETEEKKTIEETTENIDVVETVKTQEKKISKKTIYIIAGALVATLAVVYLGFSVYFMNHFHFGTKINGINVSGQTVEEAKGVVQQHMDDYQLSITAKDGTVDIIKGSDIELVVKWNNDVASYMKAQNGFAWPMKLFVPDSYMGISELSYNEEVLAMKIGQLSCMAPAMQVMPQDATMSAYSPETGYTLVPEVEGTAVKVDLLDTCVANCINNMATELVLADNDIYYLPQVLSTDETLIASIEQLNNCVKAVITFQVGSSTTVLDATTFNEWLYLDENTNVAINEERLSAYVDELAETYDTYGKAKTLKTTHGSTVTISKSKYGWKTDIDKEKTAISEEILSGTVVSRDLHYSITAASREGNDYGNSYAEINLTAQQLHFYIDGKHILTTDIVTGNPAFGWETPTGAYRLTYKVRDDILNGDDYAVFVNFWMPFNGNIGMHDNPGRSAYGGYIYQVKGSHGCVNMPYDAAQTVFSYVHAGFPVLVYELPGTETAKYREHMLGYSVYAQIETITDVTLESEAKLSEIRTNYENLSEDGKSVVDNLQILINAEVQLAALKAAATPPVDTTTPQIEPVTP